MDDLYRDIQRLEMIAGSMMGLEDFSLTTRLSDLVKYYFTKFLVNISHVTKDFSRSELEVFNSRNRHQLEQTFNDSHLALKDIIVFIPKGMIHSYKETLNALILLLSQVKTNKLRDDLQTIVTYLISPDSDLLPRVEWFSKTDFDIAKKTIGSLYSVKGLTNTTADNLFDSLDEIKGINVSLMQIVKEYYPDVIEFHKLIESIESNHSADKLDYKEADKLSDVLLETAYRVSIFAIVMDHIQELEHAFMKTLQILKDSSSKNN